jgi:hypothetical protein
MSAPKVSVVDAPVVGTAGQTIVLAPLSANPSASPAQQGIKVPIGPGHYYLVEARRAEEADALPTTCCGDHIYDEGLRIQEITESADPPAANIDSCDTVVPVGCQGLPPTCSSGTTVFTRPGYCWPYPLWHPGQRFEDSKNGVEIAAGTPTGNGFAVTVTRGASPSHPDVYLVPWQSPPMNSWETVDIWVDSSCNGYESAVGAKGLRYGRRADGSVIGNGDDPCANHENRIYAVVRNGGNAAAKDIHVRFNVANPLGVGIAGSKGWTPVATATASDFPALSSLAPGGVATVFVRWKPDVKAPVAVGKFNFHSCLQVVVDKVEGEAVTSNQDGDGEQENVGNFEAVLDMKSLTYHVASQEIFLHSPFGTNDPSAGPATFALFAQGALSRGGSFVFNRGSQAVTVPPGETVRLPLRVRVAKATPLGRTMYVTVQGSAVTQLRDPDHPKLFGQLDDVHLAGMGFVAGVVLGVQTVRPTTLTLRLARTSSGIMATGRLTPAKRTLVAVDYEDQSGIVVTRLAPTNAHGAFRDMFRPGRTGTWHARALWQGDRSHSSAISRIARPTAG